MMFQTCHVPRVAEEEITKRNNAFPSRTFLPHETAGNAEESGENV